MSQKDYYDIGRAINQFIQDLKNAPVGGFTNVKNGVDEAARQFKDEVKNAAKGFKVEINPGARTQPKEPPRSNQQWNSQGTSTNGWQKPAIYPQKKSIPGRTAGILFTVFGWIGLVPSAIVLLTLLSVGLTESNTGTLLTSTLILVPIIAAFLFMICKGNSLLARVRRFLRYRTFLKGSSFASIEHLAAFSGRQKDFVVKDLKKMIQNGMFEQAFLDEEETCIMLDRDTYQQYLNLQKRMDQKQENSSNDGGDQSEQAAMIAVGREYISQIRAANDAIPGQEISEKLDKLESVTAKVFWYVEQHPEKLSDIQNFMSYYLPTTLKLVNAYREFGEKTEQSQEIQYAQSEILHILDTINLAFANLLNSLYEEDILDITTDISTLEKVLAQDGLTGTEFKMPQREKEKEPAKPQ